MPEFRAVVHEGDRAEAARLARGIWNEHYVPIIGQVQFDCMFDRFQSAEAVAGRIAEGYE
jgi:hypothetical protein